MGKSALVAILLVLLAGCAPAPGSRSGTTDGAEPASQAPQRTVVIGMRGEPPSLARKALVPFSPALRHSSTLFNATLDWIDEREEPHALLAEALPQLNTDTWRVFPDGRMETLYRLKPGLTWHDGSPLSSEDFVFAWRVYAKPELGNSTSSPIGLMEEVLAPDPRTVVIRWREPFADGAALDDTFQALPKHILERPFEDLDPLAFVNLAFWTQEYVGLGPYRVERWEPGAFIEGRAFDGYAGGRAKISQVRVVFVVEPNTALANLLAGEVHYVGENVLAEDHGGTLENQWAASQGGTVLYAPSSLRLSVVQHRPEYAEPKGLQDLRVRRALAYGIDAQLANEVLNNNKGLITHSLTSPGVSFYSQVEPSLTKYPYDPRRSEQLMQEAGFARGADGFFVGADGTPFRLGVWSSSGSKNEQENAVIVDGLRKSGFDANRNIFSAAQLDDAQARAVVPGLSTRGQPTKGRTQYTSEQIPGPGNRWRGDNRGGWANADYDRAFDAYNKTLDPSQRIRHIAEMERIYSEQLPSIPHWLNPNITAHVAALKGPVPRYSPDAGNGVLRVSEWEWR